MVFVMLGLGLAPSPVAAADYRFTGSVSASGVLAKMHQISLSQPGTINATLNWTQATADLDLYLKNPSGVVVASRTSTTARPEQITYEATTAGRWTLRIVAKKGTSAYTLNASVTLAAGGGETFAGTVSATGTSSALHPVTLANPGMINASLNWTQATADLNLYLRNPSGTIVASRTSTTARPESIAYSASTAGIWTLRVVAKTGSSNYTLTTSVTTKGDNAPKVVDDKATSVMGRAVSISVLTNDKDPESEKLSIGAVSASPGGIAAPNPDGTITYTPKPWFIGRDYFTYESCDAGPTVLCSRASVTVTVDVASAPENPIPIWAAEFMVFNTGVTLANAVEQAKRFDVLASTKSMYPTKYTTEMKAANPDLQLLVYVNAVFARKDEGTLYPSAWYAHDVKGNKVVHLKFGDYLMDPSHPGWIQNVEDLCLARMAENGYTGCFLDVLGPGALNGLSGAPVNPATGVAWTDAEWLQRTAHLARETKSVLSPAPVHGNGLITGEHYFDPLAPTAPLLAELEGVMAEQFVRPQSAPFDEFRDEGLWHQELDMLTDARTIGNSVLAMTKVWSSATEEQKDAWHRYALATFLLAGDGSYFAFRYDHKPTFSHPWWEVDLGVPVGSYTHSDGIYKRNFSKGKVLVNPTAATIEVPLGGTYVTLSGDVSTSLTVAPHSGEILRAIP